MGQTGVCRIHESIHCTWKLWPQLGNNLHTSPILKFSKQTAQSTRPQHPFSLHAFSSYSKQGRFFRLPTLLPPNILFMALMLRWVNSSSLLLLFPVKALPTTQTWMTIKIAIPIKSMIKEITISIIWFWPNFHSLVPTLVFFWNWKCLINLFAPQRERIKTQVKQPPTEATVSYLVAFIITHL